MRSIVVPLELTVRLVTDAAEVELLMALQFSCEFKMLSLLLHGVSDLLARGIYLCV